MTRVHSCVVDAKPKYAYQAMLWLNTLRTFGDPTADRIVVHAVRGVDERTLAAFRSAGADVVPVDPFDPRHPHSNKLAQVTSPALKGFDHVVLSDCDIAFADDVRPWIAGGAVRAKPVDTTRPPLDVWLRILEAAGLSLDVEVTASTHEGRPTLHNNCNGGLYVIPRAILEELAEAWPRWNAWALGHLGVIGDHAPFVDQISFALAMQDLGHRVNHLGLEMNFPTHLALGGPAPPLPPRVLHYHDRVDKGGFLLPTGLAAVDRQVEKVNAFIRDGRRSAFDNFAFWEFRYSLFPDAGSGVGSRGAALDRKRGLLSEQLSSLRPPSVLDVGCGDLEVTRHARVADYTGIDLSPAAIEIARAKRPDWRFLSGDVSELGLEPRALVLCLDVLIHQPTRQAYERTCARILSLASEHLLVGAYNQPPWHTSELTFYYEPISATLRRLAPGELEVVGGYRDTTVVRWTRPA